MAESIILVKPAQLLATAGNIEILASNVVSLTSSMTEDVMNCSSWAGEAANVYKNKFGQLEEDMQMIRKMLNEDHSDLTAIAQKYISTESENQSEGNSLAGGVLT